MKERSKENWRKRKRHEERDQNKKKEKEDNKIKRQKREGDESKFEMKNKMGKRVKKIGKGSVKTQSHDNFLDVISYFYCLPSTAKLLTDD